MIHPGGISAGDEAPDFTLAATGGSDLTLSSLSGHQVVLYFYPRDSTPACTREAQDFSALAPAFAAADTTVIGVSADSLRRHERFCRNAGIGIRLVSDPEGAACRAWGVWGEKRMMGRRYLGIIRSTFLVGRDFRVLRAWSPARVPGHAAEVLAAAEAAAHGVPPAVAPR